MLNKFNKGGKYEVSFSHAPKVKPRYWKQNLDILFWGIMILELSNGRVIYL